MLCELQHLHNFQLLSLLKNKESCKREIDAASGKTVAENRRQGNMHKGPDCAKMVFPLHLAEGP